jgi:peroxiredoxin
MQKVGFILALCCIIAAGFMIAPQFSSAGPAPDFSLYPRGAQAPVSLRDLKGQVVVLGFMSGQCEPCRMAITELESLRESVGARGAMVLGVVVDDQGDAHGVMQELGGKFTLLTGGAGAARDYGVEALPTVVVVDRQGQVVLRESGWSSVSAGNIRGAVFDAMGRE